MSVIVLFVKKAMLKAKYIRNLLTMDGDHLLFEDGGFRKTEN